MLDAHLFHFIAPHPGPHATTDQAGGISAQKPVDDEVRNVYASVAAAVEAQAGVAGAHEIHAYSTQVVAGTNFFVKVTYGDKCVHARIFRDLQRNATLHSVQAGKAVADAITYF